MEKTIYILLFINFFFLSLTILAIYYYAHRLRFELKKSNRLRLLAEKYRNLFNATTEGVFQAALDGSIILMNTGGANILGFENSLELRDDPTTVQEFFLSAADWDALVKRVQSEGIIRNEIIHVKNRMGEELDIEFTLNPCKIEKEKTIGLEGIFRDVTERIKLQNALRSYSVELEKKVEQKTGEVLALERRKLHLEGLASLGQMAASIVHEIRNPLSSIKMGLNTLLKRAKLESKDYRCTEVAAREVTHLEKILRDILIFAKPEELKFIEHDLNKVLDLALDQIESEFKEAHVVIHRQLEPDLPRVMMDINKMTQVILNVLINAKQSIEGKGEVSILTHLNKKENWIHLEFRDNGMGIDEDSLKKVFDPFFSNKKEGTGLGLTIVQKTVDAHSGQIEMESQVGEGTIVRIKLPVYKG